MLLMGPGPTNVHPEVWAALCCPQTSHRHDWMAAALEEISRGVRDAVAPSGGYVGVPFVCSGMGVTEALVGLAQRTLLLPAQGRYARRVAEIARRLGVPTATFSCDEFAGADPGVVDRALAARADVSDVFIVHNETTTGALTDLAAVGDVCRRRGVRLLVDIISSAGAHELDLARNGVAAACLTLNKAFEGVSGLSLVVASPDLLRPDGGARSHYFDLSAQADGLLRSGGLRFTAPGPLVAANQAAVRRLTAESVAGRARRYAALRDQLAAGVRRLGWTALGEHRPTRCSYLSVFQTPPEINPTQLRMEMLAHDIEIYIDPESASVGRIYFATMGHMGSHDVARFCAALAACLNLATSEVAG